MEAAQLQGGSVVAGAGRRQVSVAGTCSCEWKAGLTMEKYDLFTSYDEIESSDGWKGKTLQSGSLCRPTSPLMERQTSLFAQRASIVIAKETKPALG